MKKKLAIITTHSIQYNAPWFKMLADRGHLDLKVFYTWPQAINGYDDPDFGNKVEWDIPLLEGYSYDLVENVSKHPTSKNYKGIDNPDLINGVKNFAPNAILIFGWKFKSHFGLMRHFKGKVPIWFRGDSTLLDYDIQSLKQLFKSTNRQINKSTILQLLKYKLRQTILSFVYRYIDNAFYVGTNSKAYFKAHGLKESQLIYAPHAIDNERFSSQPSAEEKAKQWRKRLGLNLEDKVVLFAGKLESKKNPMLLLKAIQQHNNSELTIDNSPIKLIFLGSGPLEQELKKQAKDDTNIIFLPFQNQSNMPVVYRLADVFCLPSKGPEETWGLAVNEALACGRPVLISDKVGCAVDIVKNQIGRIFKSNDMHNLIQNLSELLNQSSTPEKYQGHISKWSFESICASIEKEIKKV